MNCTKCNNPVPEGIKFCPHCGQKLEAAPAEPVRRYESGDMPEPEIRFSKNLKEKAQPAAPQQPASQTPLYQPAAPSYTPPAQAAAPSFAPPVAEKPVFTPPVAEQPVFTPPVAEQPVFTPPVAEQPVFTPPVAEQPAYTAPAAPKALAEAVCPVCRTAFDYPAKFCNVCGSPISAPAAEPPKPAAVPGYAAPRQPKPSKPAKQSKPMDKKLVLILAAVALIAVVGVVIAGIALGWFGGSAPLTALYDAAEKTLYAGGFEVEFAVEIPGQGEITGTADCILDVDAQELTLLAELDYNGQTIKLGVMDGVAVMQQPNGQPVMLPIGDVLDTFFDEMEDPMSFEEALEEIVEVALQEADMEDIVDGDVVIDCFGDSLNNASWLKENAGYTTENDGGVKMHVFAPKLGNLALAALEAFAPAFEDEDMVDEAVDALKDSKGEMNKMAKVEFAFGIEGGKLVKLTADITIDGETAVAEITFDNVGSAKVDTDAIEEMIDAAG